MKSVAIICRVLALLLTSLVSGCSFVQMAYNQLPELTYWWADSYLDLTDAQSVGLRQHLRALQDWHRQAELPLYAQTLTQLATLAPGDITAPQVCQVVDTLRPRLQALADQAAPGLATLASSLKPAQLVHLQRQLEKRAQKWQEEWLDGSPTERQEHRLKRQSERFETFYGALTPTQRSVLRTQAQASRFDVRLAQAELLRRQNDILQTLRSNTDIRELLARTITSPDPQYQRYLTALTQENCANFAEFHNQTDATQRRKLAGTLTSYAADARALDTSRP